MKWIRANIQHVAGLALFALLIQLGFSFGHFHRVALAAADTAIGAQADASQTTGLRSLEKVLRPSVTLQPASDHDSDRQSHDPCDICAVMALASIVLLSTPATLSPPQATEFLYLASGAELVRPSGARVAFQPRAPPLS